MNRTPLFNDVHLGDELDELVGFYPGSTVEPPRAAKTSRWKTAVAATTALALVGLVAVLSGAAPTGQRLRPGAEASALLAVPEASNVSRVEVNRSCEGKVFSQMTSDRSCITLVGDQKMPLDKYGHQNFNPVDGGICPGTVSDYFTKGYFAKWGLERNNMDVTCSDGTVVRAGVYMVEQTPAPVIKTLALAEASAEPECHPACRADEVCTYVGLFNSGPTTCEPKEVPEPDPGLGFDCTTTQGSLQCEAHGMHCCPDPNGEGDPPACHARCLD
jgi:hypothetical protein